MRKYDVAAYIWPSYTCQERRALQFWPEGIGEWQTVKTAESRFPGHVWPRIPMLGYQDEADPHVMEQQIELAVTHGVNVFIYDWYWYDDRPFLEQCLDNGFLQASNREKMKFYLMWANHDATSLWDKRIAEKDIKIWSGSADEKRFDRICDRVIDLYFSSPGYYCVNGCPVFSIYDVSNLINGFGGMDPARRALDRFREKTVKAGFPGLHLQMIVWNENAVNVSGVDGKRGGTAWEAIRRLLFDSITHYQFVHFLDPDISYPEALEKVESEWRKIEENASVPYSPHISIGWDNNPRFRSFRPDVMRECTPDHFEIGLRMAKEYIDRHPQQHPLITLNSWNEWTEGSYLLPDDLNGFGFLDAVRRVFGNA
jgi:hypothetical protein